MLLLPLPTKYLPQQGLTQAEGKGSCWAAATPPPPILNEKKNADFIDTTLSNVLRDLPFSRNQPQKSSDDWYVKILKKIKFKTMTTS
jgi:hypothetical protein